MNWREEHRRRVVEAAELCGENSLLVRDSLAALAALADCERVLDNAQRDFQELRLMAHNATFVAELAAKCEVALGGSLARLRLATTPPEWAAPKEPPHEPL